MYDTFLISNSLASIFYSFSDNLDGFILKTLRICSGPISGANQENFFASEVGSNKRENLRPEYEISDLSAE
jgi:hypothetical protein